MGISQNSSRYQLPLLVQGQGQKDVTHNEALIMLDAIIHPAVVSRTVDVPHDPRPGMCWLVPETQGHDWDEEAGVLAVWTDGGWRRVELSEGARIWVQDEKTYIRLDHDGAWVVDSQLPGADKIAEPAGGEVVDVQARAAIAALISLLKADQK